MGAVQELPVEVKITQRENEAAEIAERKAEAQFHFDQICTASKLQSRNTLRIGFHALRLKEQNAWGLLGHKTENDAREAAGVGESTWYSVIRIAEAFKPVPEELFVDMKLSNAKLLSDMPESKRADREWLGWAATESLKAFEARVDVALTGKARDSDSRENVIPFKITMPASQKRAVESGLKQYAEQMGIEATDTGKVLEVMVAEHTGSVTLIGSITAAVREMKEYRDLWDSDLSTEELLQKGQDLNDKLILDFAKALEQASQREK